MRKKILFLIFAISIFFAWRFFFMRNTNPVSFFQEYFYEDHVLEKQYGTTYYDTEKAQPGYTIVSPYAVGELIDYQTSEIINMEGEVVHQWKTSFDYKNQENKPDRDHLLLRLLPNGDALVLTYEDGLARITWDSDTVWSIDGFFHHDIQFTDEYIYTLKWKNNFIEYNDHILPIMDEILVTLDYDGNIVSEVSLFDTFRHLLPSEAYENIIDFLHQEEGLYDLMQGKPDGYYLASNLPWDIFHMNALHYIHEDTDSFRQGQFLVSMRSINTIAVFDPETMDVVWEYTGDLIKQHNPTLLFNGNILVYDNGGVEEFNVSIVDGEKINRYAKRSYTRIIEINPRNKKIVWEYVGDPKNSFFAKIMGGAQRLENGNTLIVDSLNGISYEVSQKGEIVWEHHQPEDLTSHYRAYRLGAKEVQLVDSLLMSNNPNEDK